MGCRQPDRGLEPADPLHGTRSELWKVPGKWHERLPIEARLHEGRLSGAPELSLQQHHPDGHQCQTFAKACQRGETTEFSMTNVLLSGCLSLSLSLISHSCIWLFITWLQVADPYVKIWCQGGVAVGVSEDSFKTDVVSNNGFSPSWHKTFTFLLERSELGLLTITVRDQDLGKDDDLCHYSIPIECIR